MQRTELLQNVVNLTTKKLQPLVTKIDQEGLYPKEYLQNLGALGGFSALGEVQDGGSDLGLDTQIEIIQSIGKVCGSTAFSVWCQSACAWYLHKSSRPAVRKKYLKDVLQGTVLAGTGMSNTIKHLSKIEKHLLQAKKTDRGYIINGVLPWVSNIGIDHVWAATAKISDSEFIMFMVNGQTEGIQLNKCPQFCALEGTNTFAIRFTDVVIQEDDLLADPTEFNNYIQSIKPGFILLQIGIGAGIIEGCIQIMEESNILTEHVNCYLDSTNISTKNNLNQLLTKTLELARSINNTTEMLPILETRLNASELSLEAAQSAALHAGAKGYLMRHAAQRRSREALFVAIVTPAIKHLRQDIHHLRLSQ